MKRMYAVDANRMFLLSIAGSELLLYAVSVAGLREQMLLQLLAEVCMVLPCVAYLFVQRRSVKEGIRLQCIGWKSWVLLVPLALCVNRVAEFINAVSRLFTTNTIGSYMAELITGYPFTVAFFVIAVVPALCEEWIFRGILYDGYKRSSAVATTVLTALLFGLMHMNWNQFFYAFFVGLVFAVINEVTGSILPSVLMHLYMNGRSVVLLYLTEEVTKGQAAAVTELVAESGGFFIRQLLPGTIFAFVGGSVLFVLLLLCNGGADRCRELFHKNRDGEDKEAGSVFRTIISPELIIGILVCIAFMVWK